MNPWKRLARGGWFPWRRPATDLEPPTWCNPQARANPFAPGPAPVPGQPHPREGAASPGRRAPAPADDGLGPCYATTSHHEHGLVIINHVLGTRRVLRNAEGDDAWIARFKHGLKQL